MNAKEPTLASRVYHENGQAYVLFVHGGLHYIRGNSSPYFGITAEVWKANGLGNKVGRDMEMGGCLHDLILRFYPKFAPLVALHLSDMNGAPMYAVENGFYRLLRAEPLFLDLVNLDWWAKRDEVDHANERAILRDHLRISEGEVESLLADMREVYTTGMGMDPAWAHEDDGLTDQWVTTPEIERKANLIRRGELKTLFAEYVETQRERWAREAEEAIKQFGLVVYGDEWTGEAK